MDRPGHIQGHPITQIKRSVQIAQTFYKSKFIWKPYHISAFNLNMPWLIPDPQMISRAIPEPNISQAGQPVVHPGPGKLFGKIIQAKSLFPHIKITGGMKGITRRRKGSGGHGQVSLALHCLV